MLLLQKIKSKNLIFIFFLIIFSIPAIFPLFHKGFFQTDDGDWMIIRFSAFHETLRTGQFPVRFLTRLNFGYGYPVANFLYPGFLYIAELIHIFKFNFVDTIKIIFGFSLIGSCLFSFFWLKYIFDRLSALIGSLLYLYMPYHLYDLYKRGSLGEVLALFFVSFILWAIEKDSFFFSSIGLSLLILSHNSLALLFLPVIFIYMLIKVCFDNKKIPTSYKIYKYIKIALIALALSSFFWLPAIAEIDYTNFRAIEIADLKQYFFSFSEAGIVSFFIIILSGVFLIWQKLRFNSFFNKNNFYLACLFLFLGILSLILAGKVSLPIWPFLPNNFIQFPFRFLSYLILSVSFLSAFLVNRIGGFKKYILIFIILILIILSVKKIIVPNKFFDKGDLFYSTNESTTTVRDEYTPYWVKEKPVRHFNKKVEVLFGTAKLDNSLISSKQKKFDVFILTQEAKLRINTIFYPGWKIIIDGKNTNIDFSNKLGVMDFLIKGYGKHIVTVRFEETPLRLFADGLSLVGLLFLIGFSRKYKIES